MFEIVVEIIFQNTFCFKMYQNIFFKKIFLKLAYENDLKLKKSSFFFKIHFKHKKPESTMHLV
jgi:hypothetical protein